jgi:hypothetical protein
MGTREQNTIPLVEDEALIPAGEAKLHRQFGLRTRTAVSQILIDETSHRTNANLPYCVLAGSLPHEHRRIILCMAPRLHSLSHMRLLNRKAPPARIQAGMGLPGAYETAK